MPSLKHIKSTVTHLLRRGTGRPADAAAFPGSAAYWNQRYVQGGDSGVGSYGRFAAFKARVLNQLFVEHGVHSVVEFGCGDGNQLASLVVDDYLGVDVSPEAMRELALQRGLAVRDTLIGKGLASERLFLGDPKLRAGSVGEPAWTPQVKLSLDTK